ncbi:MAG TPA: SHOCT domain-containing protein [Streptosporangiaceae bacterium]|jgi:hypothetical protein
MPTIAPADLRRGRPVLLRESGLRHSLGWQDNRRAGPGFVVVQLGGLDRVKVLERFPLTETGWAAAWLALSGRDAEAASAIATKLTQLRAGSHATAALVALDAESFRYLPALTFRGGSGAGSLTEGNPYDVRFLRDRVIVCPPRSAAAMVEVRYLDVEAVEVSGPVPGRSAGELAVLILGLGLLGALLGLILFRSLVGFLLGAVVFGLVGALAGASSSKIGTIVRIRGRDAELYFVNTLKPPDALRIELSEVMRTIESARTVSTVDSREPADLAPGSIPDQLGKLASLLEQGLISRDEFDHLKAKLIATS